jgi:hypothetical protein
VIARCGCANPLIEPAFAFEGLAQGGLSGPEPPQEVGDLGGADLQADAGGGIVTQLVEQAEVPDQFGFDAAVCRVLLHCGLDRRGFIAVMTDAGDGYARAVPR